MAEVFHAGLGDSSYVASALRLHFSQIPRLVAALALLIQLGHRCNTVKCNKYAAGGTHDCNACIDAVANALQQLGFIFRLFVGGVLHLTDHIVNHAIAV